MPPLTERAREAEQRLLGAARPGDLRRGRLVDELARDRLRLRSLDARYSGFSVPVGAIRVTPAPLFVRSPARSRLASSFRRAGSAGRSSAWPGAPGRAAPCCRRSSALSRRRRGSPSATPPPRAGCARSGSRPRRGRSAPSRTVTHVCARPDWSGQVSTQSWTTTSRQERNVSAPSRSGSPPPPPGCRPRPDTSRTSISLAGVEHDRRLATGGDDDRRRSGAVDHDPLAAW